MWWHYIKIAFRNMRKKRVYSGIMIGGFAIGIAACLLIGLLIHQELSYDSWIKNPDRVFRLVGMVDDHGKVSKGVSFPAPMAQAIALNFPEVEKAGRLMPNNLFNGAGSNELRKAGQEEDSYEQGFCYADPSILDILQIPLLYGSRATALSEPGTMVISKRKADKFFPGENPVGKIMYLNNDTRHPMRIGGVMENFPVNSHLQYDYFISLVGVRFWKDEQETWNASNYSVYLQLRPGVKAAGLQKRITETIIRNYLLPNMNDDAPADRERVIHSAHLLLQPVRDIHLHSFDIQDWVPRGDMRLVWQMGAIALFILLIACINFLNLSTARAANRAREVGVRKVIGSLRSHLVRQFLSESILYSALAFGLAVALAYAALPLVKFLSGKPLEWPGAHPAFWLLIPVGALLLGLLSGIYPSFYLSSFRPIEVLKGKLSLGSRNSGLRSTLVVFQFSTTLLLLIGTLVIYRQMQFILQSKPGFDKEQVLLIEGAAALGNQANAFRQQLTSLPSVQDASISDFQPVSGTKRNGNTFWKEGGEGLEPGTPGQIWQVDDRYRSTLGLELDKGRFFSPQLASDSQAAVINEAMAARLGLQHPIGRRITNGGTVYTVIGVLRNFYFESMREQVRPLCLVLGRGSENIAVRFNPHQTKAALAGIERIWKSFVPQQELRYAFMDERFARMYADVKRSSILATSFSLLAILVACLGLFGLAAFMSEQRRREISIRKILGASVPGVFVMLSGYFMKLVAISLVIAVPLGAWMMHSWLQNYAYRIQLSWDLFALAGLLVLLAALATVAYQALKLALVNPSENLRSE